MHNELGREDRLPVGVVGVGSMGRHHARAYAESQRAELVGVADADADLASTVAAEYGTVALPTETLFERAAAVSVAVPTAAHADVARAAIDRDVHVLVEKPFVSDPADGRALVKLADERGVVLQVGHVERFNPAVAVLADIIADLDVIAVEARRLGPPVDRSVDGSVAIDLMIHDVDVISALLDGEVVAVDAAGARDNRYVVATLTFDDGVIASLTASRLTQDKVRELVVTARECRVVVDYIDQTVHVHRRSQPQYVSDDGDVRYLHESVIERPTVESGEPLKRELEAFVAAASGDAAPVVTGDDGLRALDLVRRIDAIAARPIPARATPEVVVE